MAEEVVWLNYYCNEFLIYLFIFQLVMQTGQGQQHGAIVGAAPSPHHLLPGLQVPYGFPLYFYFIYLFLERGKGGKKRGRELSICKRNIDRLPLAMPQSGTWPATQTCALTEN